LKCAALQGFLIYRDFKTNIKLDDLTPEIVVTQLLRPLKN